MNSILLLSMIILPLVWALFIVLVRRNAVLIWLAPWTAIPALLVPLVARGTSIDVPWLLLGTRIEVDTLGWVFLALTSVLWLSAGVYAVGYLRDDDHRSRFFAFYLLAMVGNFGVTVSQDMASFYLFFSVMGLASYVLIVHDGKDSSHWAAQIYLILTLLSEVLVFAAILVTTDQTGAFTFEALADQISEAASRRGIMALFVIGFGIKLGIVPLHFWLPLAHPAAPTPASAVLSGAMIKAGLIGWLRFFPLGGEAVPFWGDLLILLGLTSAILGVLIGLTQRNPKTVLAYSSVSQMGLLSIGVGAGLLAPAAWTTISTALMIGAVHHGLSKGALFLSVGIAPARISGRLQRGLLAAGLVLPALALAGLPLTSGLIAKLALSSAARVTPDPWAALLAQLLPVTAVGTMLLMVHFLVLIWPRSPGQHSLSILLWGPWALLIAGVAAMFWTLRWFDAVDPAWVSLPDALLWKNLWPIVVGIVLAAFLLGWKISSEWLKSRTLPAGDLLIPILTLLRGAQRVGNWGDFQFKVGWRTSVSETREKFQRGLKRVKSGMARISAGLENWTTVGALSGVLAVLFYWLLSR